METKYIIGFVAAIVIILGGIGFLNYRTQSAQGGEDLIPFAQCLKNSQVTFYGAFWCPHCQATKKMFGLAQKELPYTECSTADGKGQTQICIDKKISSYPTWEFADGSRLTGEQPLSALAQKSNCPLPSSRSSNAPSAPVNTGTSSAATQ